MPAASVHRSRHSVSLLLGNHRLVALADIFSEDSSSSICQLDVRYSVAFNPIPSVTLPAPLGLVVLRFDMDQLYRVSSFLAALLLLSQQVDAA